MNVNRSMDKIERPPIKPVPAPAQAGAVPSGNFSDVLKSAQAASNPTPTVPLGGVTSAPTL